MKKTVIGVLAHVDAGKTTLCEGLLYLTGKIKNLGRVDHRDAFLDTHRLERARGITIFSKQARLPAGATEITLLDTPGHADFSAEMERTLRVLDYAILTISGSDGIQAHTETVWRLLRRYQIPTFLFVSKTDLVGFDKAALLSSLRKHFGEGCVDFSTGMNRETEESIVVLEEALLNHYLENGGLKKEDIAALVSARKLFPCYFGSGLKLTGLEPLLAGLDAYTGEKTYPEAFGARVYKISRDGQGNRLTHLKVTGGILKVRAPLSYRLPGGEGENEEKITQIRVYDGDKYEAVDAVTAGDVCAVLGLSQILPGAGLGFEEDAAAPLLLPVLTYRVLLPEDCDARAFLPKLRLLEEEDPALHIVWNEALKEIYVQLMGEVQIEVLTRLIEDRFGVAVAVDGGRIMYKETIASPVVGMGHFEPLRHYAEVHLLLEPLETGSGLVFEANCPEDMLDRNVQRLVLNQLTEGEPVGVLTGSPLTDLKITLVAGRFHATHSDPGDFRQAACRALRQGLMQAESVLLEPYYDFELSVPAEQVGRAINDLQAMNGTFGAPTEGDGMMVLSGSAPVAAMRHYFTEVVSYTRGKGRLNCTIGRYAPCCNAEQVIADSGYDPERDLDHPADSVFCVKGSGLLIKWDHVKSYMHVDSGVQAEASKIPSLPNPGFVTGNFNIDEKELEAIMIREFGPIKRPQYLSSPDKTASQREARVSDQKSYLIVDGYNIIFAWDGLKELAAHDLAAARQRLIEVLANYRGFVRCELVLVFDGYKIKGNQGERYEDQGLYVVYTKEGETADMYIEKLLREIGKNYAVRVATSDGLIQLSAATSGILRMSALELKAEIELVGERMEKLIARLNRGQ